MNEYINKIQSMNEYLKEIRSQLQYIINNHKKSDTRKIQLTIINFMPSKDTQEKREMHYFEISQNLAISNKLHFAKKLSE